MVNRRSPVLAIAGALVVLLGGIWQGDARADGGKARVRGKVARENEGVAGARVFAYRSFEDLLALRPGAVSEPTAAAGAFRLELPEGTYYLVAKRGPGAADGRLSAGDLFSFHGSNPFTLPSGSETEVNFSLARRLGEPRDEPGAEPGSGTLSGIVTHQGKPLEGVSVRLYLDAQGDFRGGGYATAPPTDEHGAFQIEYLPESDYFVIARKRASGTGAGPLADGDFYGYFVDNPVSVRAGSAVHIEIEALAKGREAGNADSRPRPSGTRIAGRITDTAGAAVRGVYAFAYEEKVMSHKKPAFLSPEVDAAGRYVLNLSRGGTYYIGARSAYGDSPAKGEWYGRYEGSADHGVTVATGASLEGIDIVVERILQ